MNQIFRVVWNHATQSWVAVSELTKAHKKASTSNAIKVMLGSTALLFSLNSAEAAVSISGTINDQINSTGAKTTHDEAVAIGGNSEAYGEGTVAIGKNAGVGGATNGITNISIGKNARTGMPGQSQGQSIAIGGGRRANAGSTDGAWAKGAQSIAIGGNTIAEGDSSIAIGGDDVDDAVKATVTYTNPQDGTSKTDTIKQAFQDLTGVDILNPRWTPTTASHAATAIGMKAEAKELAVSMGTLARAQKVNSVALGSGALATLDNSIALGAGSKTDKEGTKQTKTTVQGITYNWAGGDNTSSGDVVSIGSVGYERQLKNVAAGEVSETSTDGINGSQLFGILNGMTLNPTFLYAGDDADKGEVTGEDADAKKADATKKKIVVRSMKDGRLNLLGGATGDLSENNIAVKYGNDNTLNVKLAKDLKDLTSTNVGGIVTNADGINMNNKPITNVAGNLPGAKNGSTVPTTSGTLPEGADAPKTSNAATVGDVLNAGWNLTEKGVARDFVKPYDTVDFIDGKGTSVNVTTDTDGKVSHIKYDVKAADDSITVGDDGIKVNTGVITPVTKDDGDKKSGQVAPNKGDENKVASVGDVANAINNAFWKVTGAEDGGEFAEGNTTTEEQVKAGDKVTFKAGKNIKLKQDGKNFTYSLNPVLTDMTSIGGNGTTMTFNPNGVDLGDKNITGVKSALNTTPVTTTPDGSPTADADKPNLVDLVGTKDAPVNKNAAATVGDLQNMGWVVSSDKTTDALDKAYKDTVKNANEVKFIGTGAATVSGKTVDGIRTITVDVKQPETETLTSTGGKVTNPEGDSAKKLVTAGNVADMINKSGFNLKTSADKNSNGEKAKGTKDDGELINPGATVEMVAGKNMSVKQDADGKVTYATKEDVEFTSVKLGKAEENGKQPVNLKTENATPADNNQDSKAPTTALNFSSGEGDKATPTQLKGVGSVLNTKKVPTAPEGTTTPEDKQPKLVNLGSEDAPLSDDVLNSAATVRDLANMGWVVGAPENGYVDTVKNANKVDFKGENGISVTGKTNKEGVREITISVAEGKVTNDVTVTKADGTVINGVKGPDGKLYEKGQDGKPDTSKPITLAEGDKVNNEGSKFVSGNAVATAIQESGWNIGKADAKDVTKAFEKEAKVHDKVNPNDDVKFVDGQNTVVKMVTVDAKNEDGSKKATTFVKVDVTGLPVQYTDKNGTPVTKVGDKYFTVDKDGNPTTTEVKPADLTTNMVNPAAKPNEIGAPTTLGNVKSNLPSVNDADKNAKDVDGKPIAGKDNKSAPIDAAKAADIAKNAGNNAATVSDVLNAGWNLQNNGKDKDFVKPYDTVNFVDGKGTKAVVKTEEDGTTSNVKFDIDTGSITNNADGSVQGPVVTPEMTKALEDATNTLNNLPANAPASVRKAAEQAVADAANNIANVANKVATAQDVANAINKSGFALTTSANGGEKISGTPEMINPGKKVEMVAGKNMTVKQESNGKVTYATASNVTFDSVQFGDNGPKITNNGGNINVGTATGAPTKITGVAPGEISATSKDAVNGSQLHAMGNKLQGQINKLGNRMNAGMATSAAMANLLQPHKPGQSVATAGVGQHKNQSAVAVGYSRLSDNGKYGVRFSMGANTQGEVTGGAAVGYFW